MPACTVCQHADRGEIDTLLVGHAPVRSIARQFGLIETSLRRHAASHLPRELARAAEGRDLERAETLLDRVEALEGEVLAVLEQARDGGDPRIVLAAIRELRANLELVGRLKGELVASGTMAVFMRFGVRDEAELGELVEAGRKFRETTNDTTMTPLDYGELALEMLVKVMPLDAQFAERAQERIGAMRDSRGTASVSASSGEATLWRGQS